MIHGIPTYKAAQLLLSDWRLFRRGISVARHALDHFFLPQFQTLFRRRLRPVASLSHPLDRGIPFQPREIATYLGYFTFWMKTLRCLFDRLGPAVLPDLREAIDEVCLLYREAGAIYRRCQSTTTQRAPMPLMPLFVVVYLLDPHKHCIPSLHILLICYNSYSAARILRRHGARGALDRQLLAETVAEARRITEAVLLVKQHSILDIAPSLYLLSALFPGYGRKAVAEFLDSLFAGWDLREAGRRRLRDFLKEAYEGFLGGNSGHRERILRFLQQYAPGGRPVSSSPRRRGGS